MNDNWQTNGLSNGISKQDSKEQLFIFDTTLRDGEQAAGASLNRNEKVEIARKLCLLGVDVCEAGFPAVSQDELESVAAVAKEVGGMNPDNPMCIAAFARTTKGDIEKAYEAVKFAPRNRIHMVMATSDAHLTHKLRITREECVRRVVEAVTYAKKLVKEVQFVAEDAGRSDLDFLCTVLGEAIRAGATVITIADTVGNELPHEFQALIQNVIKRTPGSDQVIFSTHCHNDLGLATANTLAGIYGGAREVQVTMNGIGERAGNAALEEVVMAIKTRPEQFPVFMPNILTEHIHGCSQMVSQYTGLPIQPNKAIVGMNAFRHESGIHQDGQLKNSSLYEIMRPETIGLKGSQLVLGKHSGKAAFRNRFEKLGYGVLTPDQLDFYIEKLKAFAEEEKRTITDADIAALI